MKAKKGGSDQDLEAARRIMERLVKKPPAPRSKPDADTEAEALRRPKKGKPQASRGKRSDSSV